METISERDTSTSHSQSQSQSQNRQTGSEATEEEESRTQIKTINIYYNLTELVSKPKISPKYMLPLDGRPVLEIAASLGYDSHRPENLRVLDSNTVLFIAGSYLRLYRTDSKEDSFIRCTGGGSVSCVAVATERAVFASGERGEKPDINIFGYPSCKLRKILKNGTQREYVSLMFEPTDNELLASLGGEPDYNLTIWQWLKEVPLLRYKAASQDVHKVKFSAELFGNLVSSGSAHIRFWNMAITFTGLKLNGEMGRFGGRDFSDIDAFLQLSDGKVLSGCEEGTIMLWEEGLMKAEFTRRHAPNCHAGKINQMFLYEAEVLTLGEDGYVRTWNVDDFIYVEPSYNGEVFKVNPLMEIEIGHHSALMCMTASDPKSPEACNWYAQDKKGRIWTVDLSIMLAAQQPKVMLQYHGGPVLACATSHNAHLVATTGQDGTVRIFDCFQKKEVLHMAFSAPACSIVWVPLCVDLQGASIIVGFDDGVIRKLVFCGKVRTESTEQQKLEGQVSQVFKPHKTRVTSLIFSHKGDILVTGSLDKTIFWFHITGTAFEPIGWMALPASIHQLVWSPLDFLCQSLLAVCDDGIVVQAQQRNLICNLEISDNYEFLSPRLHVFKFQSIKSKLLHAEKLTRMQTDISRIEEKEAQELKELEDEAVKEPDEDQKSKDAVEGKHSKQAAKGKKSKEGTEDQNSKDAEEDKNSKQATKDENLKVATEDQNSKDAEEDKSSKQATKDEKLKEATDQKSKEDMDDQKSKDAVEGKKSKRAAKKKKLKDSAEDKKSKDAIDDKKSKDAVDDKKSKDAIDDKKSKDAVDDKNSKKAVKAKKSKLTPEEEEKQFKEAAERKKSKLVAEFQKVKKSASDALLAEEKEWQPYYPDSPSPILQVVYSKMINHFWLTLGEYDAGYVYLCRFPDTHYQGDDTSKYVRKPEKAVAVPDCSEKAITMLKVHVTPWQTLVLMGFQNGHIRLVQLPNTEELDDITAYWDLNAHDDKIGSITGIEFAFDRSYLVTTGMDGNIFVFTYTGLMQMSKKTTSVIPISINHHDVCEEDIVADALQFSEQMEHQKQAEILLGAEGRKKQKRRAIKQLHEQVASLTFQNSQIPLPFRLAEQELRMNANILEEHSLRLEESIAEVHKRYAWEVEKTKILQDKFRNGFLKHEDLPHEFVVKAFNLPMEVRSYRKRTSHPEFEEYLTEGQEVRKTSSVEESYETFEDNQDTLSSGADIQWTTAYKLARRRSTGVTGPAARCLQMALDKAMKAKRRREMRKKQWERLYEEKARNQKDSPEDIVAIDNAKITIGNIPLKTDPLYAVEKASTYSVQSAKKSLAQLDKECCNKINTFNEKLMALREEKILLVRVFHALNKYLYQISFGMKHLPNPPKLSEDEIPEERFLPNEENISKLKTDILVSNSDSDSTLNREPFSSAAKPVRQTRHHTGEASGIPGYVQQISVQGKESYVVEDASLSVEDMEELLMMASKNKTTLQNEMHMFFRLQTEFKASLLQHFVSNLMVEFDEKLRDLYVERFQLDVLLKRADLLYITKLEEFFLNKKTFNQEQLLMDEATKKNQEIKKNYTAGIQIKKQIAKRTEDNDSILKTLSDLLLQFEGLCVEKKCTPLMKFLTRLLKRKVSKRKQPRLVGDDDDDDDDDEVSESDSFSLESESGSDDSISLDLNYCPPDLDTYIYEAVAEMQQRRQTLDDQFNENKQNLVVLQKDNEANAKEAETLQKAKDKLEEYLQSFYQEKINLLNEIVTTVPLLISQICCNDAQGLVLNVPELKRLQARVGGLKEEIKAQSLIMKDHIKKQMMLRRANRLLHQKIHETAKNCDDDMVKKFGKQVCMKDLELVTSNPKAEMLRFRLLLDKDKQLTELGLCDKEICNIKKELIGTTAMNSKLCEEAAVLINEQRRMEKHLNQRVKGKALVVEEPVEKQREKKKDRETFRHLFQQQNAVMRGCWEDITGLLRQGSTSAHRLPPIHVKSRRTSAGKMRVEVGARKPMSESCIHANEDLPQAKL